MKRIVIEKVSKKKIKFLRAFLEAYDIPFSEYDVRYTIKDLIENQNEKITYSISIFVTGTLDVKSTLRESFKNGKEFLKAKSEEIKDVLDKEVPEEWYEDNGLNITKSVSVRLSNTTAYWLEYSSFDGFSLKKRIF